MNFLAYPYNWCDRWCERCPLLTECQVANRCFSRRVAHIARGEDPDDKEVFLADLTELLLESIRLAEAIAEEEGIDLNAEIPPPAVRSLAAEALRRDGQGYALALVEASFHHDVERLVAGAALVAGKLDTVAAHLEEPPMEYADELWAAVCVPNLLVVERVAAQLRRVWSELSLPADVRGRVAGADAAVQRQLERLLGDEVAQEVRRAVEDGIARGTAPSPFCVTG